MNGTNKLGFHEDGARWIERDHENSPQQNEILNLLVQPVRGFALVVTEHGTSPAESYFLPLFPQSAAGRGTFSPLTPTLRLRLETLPPQSRNEYYEEIEDEVFSVYRETMHAPFKLPASLTGEVEVNFAYISAGWLEQDTMHALFMLPRSDWTKSVWHKLQEHTVTDLNSGRFASFAVKAALPHRLAFPEGAEFPFNSTGRDCALLRIAFLWNYWESRQDKLYARARDINRLGIGGLSPRGVPMQEDNLQKICRRAGLHVGDCLPRVQVLAA